MARKLAATAAVLALAGVLAAGCSKKLTTQASFTVPEGVPSSQLELITFMDASASKLRIKDRGELAKVNFAADTTTDSIQLSVTGQPLITPYRNFSPGTVRGFVLNRTGAEGMEIWRTDANGGARKLFDFALQPVKRYLDGGADLYEFFDQDPNRSPNATYYARGLVGGIAGASSPISNGSRPFTGTLTTIRYTAERYGAATSATPFQFVDSLITMAWTPVPGASKYLIQIFEYQSRVLTLEERILTGTPSPLLTGVVHDHLVATVPGGTTQYKLGDPGATIYTYDPLRMRHEYYVRITALDANGAMLGTTTGPNIQQTSDLRQIFVWAPDRSVPDYFADFSSPEVASATPPAYLLYSRGAAWVSPGADPRPHDTGGGGGP